MTTLSDTEKRVRRMRKSYNDTRKQIKKAMEQCSPGTNTHLHHVKALSELDAKERAEEIALGLVPQDLGAVTKTHFAYVSHVASIPTTREELQTLLEQQKQKAVKGLHMTEADDAVREKFQQEFK